MRYLTFAALVLALTTCTGQPATDPASIVGGPFENREFMFIGIPEDIDAVDTTAGWYIGGQRLVISGTILAVDGKTPAAGVILYYYHTDTAGVYSALPGLDPRVSRHGSLRGWVRSDARGRYAIYTVRPGAYPGRDEPAHIHPAIKEPTIDVPYYLDALVFDNDPLLTAAQRGNMDNRGGSGILSVREEDGIQYADHDIILGLNIPNYPSTDK